MERVLEEAGIETSAPVAGADLDLVRLLTERVADLADEFDTAARHRRCMPEPLATVPPQPAEEERLTPADHGPEKLRLVVALWALADDHAAPPRRGR